MKETIKNSLVGVLAIFGFITFFSSSNTAPTIIHEGSNTPESHVWEMHIVQGGEYSGRAFAINKKTGEVRKYNRKIVRSIDNYYYTQKEDLE